MVTAEFALAFLAVVPVILGVLVVMSAVVVQVHVQEVARTSARMLARGDDGEAVRSHVAHALPMAHLDIATDDGYATVRVSQPIHPGGLVPGFVVTGRASTPIEEHTG